MLTADNRLYELLPAVHRERDAAAGYPLRDLLRTLAAQYAVVEDDITQLYDDLFIETAADWVVPYIGDLVGWTPVAVAAPGGRGPMRSVLAPSFSARRDVANTVAHRRRKGTLALLAKLAWDVAGWPAHAVEFYRLLGWAQHLDHQRLRRGRTADIRDQAAIQRLGGPFDRETHTVDVRRASACRLPGRFNIPSVGVFAFRLQSFDVTRTPARQHEETGNHCFSFSVLGNDAPLFARPREAHGMPVGQPGELAFPVALDPRLIEAPATARAPRRRSVSPGVYGEQGSFAIYAPDWPSKDAPQPVPVERLIPADLAGWHYRPPRGFVAVDPGLGRFVFPPGQRPGAVSVSYAYGFPARLGGGEYPRASTAPVDAPRYVVHARRTEPPAQDHFDTIQAAVARWEADSRQPNGPRAGVIELAESGCYAGPVRLDLAAGTTLWLAAASRTRPVIILQDDQPDQSDAMSIRGGAGSRVVLDGVLVTGRGVLVQGAHGSPEAPAGPDLCEVVVRHSTLVPGWTLHGNCDPGHPAEPSVVLDGTRATLRVEYSIVGAVQVVADEFRSDPNTVVVTDSVLDATGLDRLAIGSSTGGAAFVVCSFERATIIGRVLAHAVDLGSNAIFASEVQVVRRQRGCLRYSYVPRGSRTPRRHRCQPDAAIETVDASLPAAERAAVIDRVARRVRPQFESTRYGQPAYGRLVHGCGAEIRTGADDGSEMGVYHDLFEPQREASLRARLDEATPAGMDAGLVLGN